MSTEALRRIGWGLFLIGGIHGLSGAGISAQGGYLAVLIAWLAGAAWLRRDAVARRIPLVHDWQWLMTLGWPFAWLWYARKTERRWRSALGFVALPVAYPLGEVVGGISHALFS